MTDPIQESNYLKIEDYIEKLHGFVETLIQEANPQTPVDANDVMRIFTELLRSDLFCAPLSVHQIKELNRIVDNRWEFHRTLKLEQAEEK